jgi:hypothetical protein
MYTTFYYDDLCNEIYCVFGESEEKKMFKALVAKTFSSISLHGGSTATPISMIYALTIAPKLFHLFFLPVVFLGASNESEKTASSEEAQYN